MEKWTHFDAEGRSRMVDVGAKTPTRRVAVATGAVRMRAETLRSILEQRVKKGDVLTVAQLAGIQGAKHTPQLIPLCHPIHLTSVEVRLDPDHQLPGLRILAQVEAVDRTGVEMEAMTAVTVAALTVYDMCKALDREMVFSDVQLELKSGGKSGTFSRGEKHPEST
jgi:cyclic pyranopterin phosphate synthase